MAPTKSRSPARAFTVIELMVAISVSVVLLIILAFVFKVSAGAVRDANSRVGMTERLRLLNIRMRQEAGAMLPIQRLDPSSGNPPTKPYLDHRTFDVAPDGTWLMFATSTTENGLPVNVDVRYQWLQDPGGDPHKNMLVRWRDHTGPYTYDATTHQPQANPAYLLGDQSFETANNTFASPPTPSSPCDDSDVLLQNVRSVKFDVTSMDVPSGMPLNSGQPATTLPNPTDLYPRQLPAGVQLDIEFGPDQGNLDSTTKVRLYFTVYRGL